MRANGWQGGKLRQIAVGSRASHQQIARAQSQKNLVKRAVQSNDAPHRLLEGERGSRVVGNGYGGRYFLSVCRLSPRHRGQAQYHQSQQWQYNHTQYNLPQTATARRRWQVMPVAAQAGGGATR